jgi:hypothetical protein
VKTSAVRWSTVSEQTITFGSLQPRLSLADTQQARTLAWGSIAWHFVELAVAIAAGLAASSIALVDFGIDSLTESVAGFVVIWLFTGSRVHSPAAERRAQQLIAVSFFVLAAYVAVESVRTLVGGEAPGKWLAAGVATRCRGGYSLPGADCIRRHASTPIAATTRRPMMPTTVASPRFWEGLVFPGRIVSTSGHRTTPPSS